MPDPNIDLGGQRPYITITPRPSDTPESMGLTPYSAGPQEPEAKPEDLGLKPYSEPEPAAPKKPIGIAETIGRGGRAGFSFGTGPVLDGLEAAAKQGRSDTQKQAIDQVADAFGPVGPLVKPMIGLSRMVDEWMSNHPNRPIRDAYNEERTKSGATEQQAFEEHPLIYGGSMLGTALLTPILAPFKAATTVLGRVAGSTVGAITGGALFGAGGALSEGGGPSEVGIGALKGGGAGAIFGPVGALGAEGLGFAGQKAAELYRGRVSPDLEAARRVAGNVVQDIGEHGRFLTPEETAAANAAGTPRIIADTGPNSQALARSAANTSPDARFALEQAAQDRFRTQGQRINQVLQRMTGGGDRAGDIASLQQAARAVNGPRYRRAYAAGDRPIWSDELERLSNSPDVQDALRAAEKDWKAWQVADGYGGMNPPVRVTPDGRFERTGGKGAPTYPNMQFWDYATRHLADAAESNRGTAVGARQSQTARALKNELDNQVPEYAQARAGAHTFFQAQDALEAGRNFVMMNADRSAAARAFSQMSAPERELFTRGFATDLMDRVSNTRDGVNVVNQIFGSQAARDKINMVLGPQRAPQFEALMRAETIVDRTRQAVMSNSTTVRQLTEAGLAGGGAVATLEGIREHDFNPAHILTGALLFSSLRYGAQKIDRNVASRVGEMLASNDPRILQQGLATVANSPRMLNALRHFMGAGARVGVATQGLPGAAALGTTALGETGRIIGGEGEHHEKDDPTYLQ